LNYKAAAWSSARCLSKARMYGRLETADTSLEQNIRSSPHTCLQRLICQFHQH